MRRTIRRAGLAAGACVLSAAAGCGRPSPLAAPTPHQQPAAHGLTFTIHLTGTSFGGRPLTVEPLPTRYLDGVLRADFASAPDRSGTHRAAPEFHVLVNFTAKTTTVVMPASKQYWETRFDASPVRPTRSATVVSDVDVAGRAVGSGETVNGYATKRYRITTRYTETQANVRKGQGRKAVYLVEEVWVTDALKGVSDPMHAYLRLFPSAAAFGELVEKQVNTRRRLFDGLPIRTTWLLTQTRDDGEEVSRTLTIDILDLKRADLDPAAFRVPDGYGRLDLAALINAADRLLNGAKDATKSSGGRKKP